MNAAFALDGFKDYGAYGVVKFGFEVGDVIETDKFNAGDDGREWQAIFLCGGDADGAEGAAVEGIFHGENAVLGRGSGGRLAFGPTEEARQF